MIAILFSPYSKGGYYMQCGIIGINKKKLEMQKDIKISFKPPDPSQPTIVNDTWGDPYPNNINIIKDKNKNKNNNKNKIDFVKSIETLVFKPMAQSISIDLLDLAFRTPESMLGFKPLKYFLHSSYSTRNDEISDDADGGMFDTYHDNQENQYIASPYIDFKSCINVDDKNFCLKKNESFNICVEQVIQPTRREKGKFLLYFRKDRDKYPNGIAMAPKQLKCKRFEYYFVLDSVACSCQNTQGFQFEVTSYLRNRNEGK